MYSLEELEAEQRRRQRQPSTKPPTVGDLTAALGDTPPEPPPENIDKLELVRSGLRGATLGASDALGAGAATLMALPQALRQQAARQRASGQQPDLIKAIAEGVPETYRDIRDTLTYQEEAAQQAAPKAQQAAALGGAAATLGAGLAPRALKAAGPLARSTQAALQRGRQRLGTGARGGKPRFRRTAEGEWVPLNKAAEKVLKKSQRQQSARDAATLGAEVDLAEAVLGGDATPENALAGAAAGQAFPKTFQQLFTNTPLGRLVASRAAGRVIGEKWRPYVYSGMHPATRRAVNKLVKGED